MISLSLFRLLQKHSVVVWISAMFSQTQIQKNFKRSDLKAPQGRTLMVSGFTLVELLVVVSIIGTLSSTVLASLNSARVKARNTAALQLVEQYKIAFELANDTDGKYPGRFVSPWLCVGDGYPYAGGGCAFDPPLPPLYAYSQRDVTLNNALARFIPSLPPRLTVVSSSIGSYVGVESSCTPFIPAATACNRGYRLMWMLEGADQNCGERATGANLGNATYCTFISSQ